MTSSDDSDERHLIQAVLADPSSDEPRYAYARWLKAHGQEDRARLIEVQCDRDRLNDEERKLLDLHGPQWSQPLLDLGVERVAFHRGFPEEIAIAGHDLVRVHSELRAITPIRRLALGQTSDQLLQKITQLPLLSQVESLEIGNPAKKPGPHQTGPEGIRSLATSPHLTGLTRLTIHSHNIGAAGAKIIEESPIFRHLKHLTLDDPVFNRGGKTRERILTSPNLAALEELQLGGKYLTAQQFRWCRAGLQSGQTEVRHR